MIALPPEILWLPGIAAVVLLLCGVYGEYRRAVGSVAAIRVGCLPLRKRRAMAARMLIDRENLAPGEARRAVQSLPDAEVDRACPAEIAELALKIRQTEP